MNLFNRIVVATDFSEVSDAAVDYAVELAKTYGATVTLVHVYALPVYGFPSGALITTPEMATRLMAGAQEGATAACARVASSGVDIKPIVREGLAWEEVHKIADEVDADLVVIGTHGRKGIAHALLGSVAEKIVRTATRPILTIHRAPHTS